MRLKQGPQARLRLKFLDVLGCSSLFTKKSACLWTFSSLWPKWHEPSVWDGDGCFPVGSLIPIFGTLWGNSSLRREWSWKDRDGQDHYASIEQCVGYTRVHYAQCMLIWVLTTVGAVAKCLHVGDCGLFLLKRAACDGWYVKVCQRVLEGCWQSMCLPFLTSNAFAWLRLFRTKTTLEPFRLAVFQVS